MIVWPISTRVNKPENDDPPYLITRWSLWIGRLRLINRIKNVEANTNQESWMNHGGTQGVYSWAARAVTEMSAFPVKQTLSGTREESPLLTHSGQVAQATVRAIIGEALSGEFAVKQASPSRR
jgi:hypothetical protein